MTRSSDDTTQRRRRKSQAGATMDSEELALLVEVVQDYAIFFLSPEGEIRSWNTGAERIMGYTADEAIGKHFSMFYSPKETAERKPETELETAERFGRVEEEGWRVRKDGTRFWANTIITALREEGQLRGFAKVTRDMTARREAEERLRQSEEMFRLLINSVKEYAIFFIDAEGHVATWNEGARRIKGYERDEIMGRPISVFYSEEDVAAGRPQRNLEYARTHGSIEDEGWRVRKDGTRFWADVIITAVHDEQGVLRGFAKVTRDVTDRKKNEQIHQALLVAQESNRAKDEFLMTLSHELRTPMTAILGWSRLLPTLAPGDSGFREAVAAIGRSAQLQARLIDDVLDVSRIVSGKMRLSVEDLNVARLVAASVDAVRTSADAKLISITTSIAPGLGTAAADPTRFQQVLWNLLTNAVKFTPQGGSISVAARRTAGGIEISVSDTGEGIDSEFLPHIFEPFRQADSTSTRSQGGLGLGLSIVRYIVEAHGGSIIAESPGIGKGAKFTVTFPSGVSRQLVRDDREEASAATPVATDGRLPGVRILLVDDDREGRQFVRTVLQSAGATVIAVDSADAAMAEVIQQRPDLIITDIAMPGMDGFALAREIRKRPELNDVKLLALSAFPAAKVAAQESGFAEYLSKPIEPSNLVDAVARASER